MKLRTTLNGVSYSFKDINDVLAKANEPKSADRLQGIAAADETERVAAKVVLSELTVGDIVEHPAVPAEKDEVTRTELDGMNQRTYEALKNLTIGEFRNLVLSDKTDCAKIQWMTRGIIGEVAAATAKIMSAMDLVYGGSKIYKITKCRTEIGQPGTLSYRCQTNSPTDDPEEILMGVMEGLTYGCGDACIGINPVEDNFESTKRIADRLYDFMNEWKVPSQLIVLSHITTQMDAIKRGVPLSMVFQSIAGTQKANDDFGTNRDMLIEGYHIAEDYGWTTGPNLNYFETGQGSEVSIDADEGVDEMTLEGRTYGFARFFKPFMVNNVSGFIGPETIYDGKEMIRANLEDCFMGKLMGLPMGMAPCFTNHTPITIDDQQMGTMLTTMEGAGYFMGVPQGDDVMLAYQDTSFQDDIALRALSHKTPAPAFMKWMIEMGLLTEDGKPTELCGDASIFL